VCPPLDGVLNRCFPYTTLNNLDFLQVPGYIAGSTNPIFESHPEWWDVLCDLETGKVLVSATGANGRPCPSDPPKLSEADADTLEQVTAGIDAHYSEYWLRASLQEYAWQIICTRRRGGIADLSEADRVAQHLDRMRNGPKVSDAELLRIYNDIHKFIGTEDKLVEFLGMLPGSSPLGCMSPVASGLFHPSKEVRRLSALVVQTVEANADAKELVANNLSKFLLAGLPAAQPIS